MKISIINQHRNDSLGGSELQCDFIATELTSRGHDVQYIAMLGKEKNYDTSYRVSPCELNADEIIGNLLNFKPDIIYWRFNKKCFYQIAKYSNKKGLPFIFSASHIDDLKPLNFKKNISFLLKIRILANRLIQHRGFKFIDALVVNNEEFLNILSVPNQVFIPNGMTKKVIPFSWNKPYCLWVANIKEVKRPELYIELAKELEAKEVDFLMVGAIQEESFSWILNKTNLPANLHYLGKKSVEEVNGMLESSLFHVHTCHTEGFPNIFIQAWLQGVPSVSYGFDPSGYIKDNNIGYSANENWQKFLECVNELIENPQKREQMGNNALNFSKGRFEIKNSVDKLENVMKSLID